MCVEHRETGPPQPSADEPQAPDQGGALTVSPEERRRQRQRKYTISNLISLSRVLMMPAFMWAIALEDSPERLVYVIVGSIIIASTDFFDGFVARKLNQVSDWGKVFDPVADKICLGVGSIWLSIHCGLPVWIPTLVVGRDVLIVIGALVLFRKRDLVMPSNQLGRYTTGILTVTLFTYVIRWEWPQQVLIWISGIMVGLTLIVYTRNAILILRRYHPKT